MEEIATQLLQVAKLRYNDGGWDVLVECYSVDSLVAALWGIDPELPVTYDAAYDEVLDMVEWWAERQADARNSAF